MSDAGWLPPGQVSTLKFPIVGERAGAIPALAAWRLEVAGLVARPLSLSLTELLSRPQVERVCDIHCVTGWSHRGMRFTGLPLAALLAEAEVLPTARWVRFEAYSARAHDTSLPLAIAAADTWLVHSRDGRPLEPEHGYPLRTLTPSRYFYKSLKWLRRIELRAEDSLGFWERTSSYHNDARPLEGERYAGGASLTAPQLRAFRDAADFEPYRRKGTLVLGADLSAWEPRSRDLRGLMIKASDLRGANLAGCDARGSNLTRTDLRGADLRGADLRDADLEGATFAAADLRGADLRGAAFSATRFTPGALVAGLRWHDSPELLEDERAFLFAQAPPPEGGLGALS